MHGFHIFPLQLPSDGGLAVSYSQGHPKDCPCVSLCLTRLLVELVDLQSLQSWNVDE